MNHFQLVSRQARNRIVTLVLFENLVIVAGGYGLNAYTELNDIVIVIILLLIAAVSSFLLASASTKFLLLPLKAL